MIYRHLLSGDARIAKLATELSSNRVKQYQCIFLQPSIRVATILCTEGWPSQTKLFNKTKHLDGSNQILAIIEKRCSFPIYLFAQQDASQID